MKADVLQAARGAMPAKRPSKETINHPGLVRMASGADPFRDTETAFRRACRALGIDLLNRVPLENAPNPLAPGNVADAGRGYRRTSLGLYDTVCRHVFPFRDAEEFWAAGAINLEYRDLLLPVPHPIDPHDIRARETAAGDDGQYYAMLYTTLFMWGVEVLGWEVFLTAAMSDPQGFREKFLDPACRASRKLIDILCRADSPFVFLHDDLADARGPVFPPSWYDRWILPRYPELFAPVKEAGKKIIFVADGNMGPFLEDLHSLGVDGVMLENPATDFDLILRRFHGRIVIGGVETRILALSTPDRIRRHVREVHGKAGGEAGFLLSTPGGIHGGIPLENLVAYFDARAELGYTPEGWKRMYGQGKGGA